VDSLFRLVPEGKLGSRGLDGLEPQVARGGADAHHFLLVFEQGQEVRSKAGSFLRAIAWTAAARTDQSLSVSAS
jgi:hypothetical protein